MATLQDIADAAGVSIHTVARALNGSTKGHRRDALVRARRIEQLASEMGYRPNAAAKAVRTNRTMQIGVMLSNHRSRPFDNLAAFELVIGINQRLAIEDYVVVMVRVDDAADGPVDIHSRVFREHVLDGLIISGGCHPDVIQRAEEFVPHCIYVDTNRFDPIRSIRREEFGVGRMAAQAAIDRGYRRFVWFGSIPAICENPEAVHYSVTQRFEGVCSVAQQNGIPVESPISYKIKTPESIARAMQQVKAITRPDVAVIAYDKLAAVHWMTMAGHCGLTPSKDYGIACLDITHDLWRSWPTLSGVLFDRYEMGTQAAELMLSLLDNSCSAPSSRRLISSWHQGTSLGESGQGVPPAASFTGEGGEGDVSGESENEIG